MSIEIVSTKERKNEVITVEQNERAYWTKEVADQLQMGHSTLRKYCLCLEEHGYHFTKGQRGVRAFLERDIEVLAKMKEVLNETGTTLEEAVSIALEEQENEPLHVALSPEQPSAERENYRLHVATSFQIAEQLLEQQKEELLQIVRQELREEIRETLTQQEKTRLEQQEAFNRELLEKLEQQQQFIDGRMEKRDQMLMASIREAQEFRKELAATSKKGFFARLFGK